MTDSAHPLSEEYTIETPENVTFGYEVAGIGTRFIGALLDTVLLSIALVLLNVLLVALLTLAGDPAGALLLDLEETTENWVAGLVIAAYALLNFAVFWGYYIVFELLWAGQTPGKRLARTRVVRLDGSPIGWIEAAVRNLVRLIDFLPVGYGLGLVTMFCNRQARRLGDFAAGTLVVKEQGAVTLASLSVAVPAAPEPPSAPEAPAGPLPAQAWHRLTPADLELVTQTLLRHAAGQADAALLRRVAVLIATKTGAAPSSLHEGLGIARTQMEDDLAWLQAVADAYRRQAG